MRKYVNNKHSIGFEGKMGTWIRFDRSQGRGVVHIDKSMDITMTFEEFEEVIEWFKSPLETKRPAAKKKTRKKKAPE